MSDNELALDPNMYAISNVRIQGNPERLQLLIQSGNQARQFETSPEHMKRIAHMLSQAIAQYEKQHEEIDTNMPEQDEQSAESDDSVGFSPAQ